MGRGAGNHGGVVGTEPRRGKVHFPPGGAAGGGHLYAEAGVGGDASGDDDRREVPFAGCLDCFFDKGVDDRFLKAGREITELLLVEHRGMVASETAVDSVGSEDVIYDSRLQAAEGEVTGRRALQTPGKTNGTGITVPGESVDDRSSGIAEAEKLGDLVDDFTGGIVAGAADELQLKGGGYLEEAGVSS
jgi:hypothetical protein